VDINDLIQKAIESRSRARAMYSNFQVGAVAVSRSGRLYTGCNIEVSSYGLTICAERVAIFKAISEGEHDFSAIIVVADTEAVCYPCGACRQVITDYAPQAKIVCANLKGRSEIFNPSELLPHAFGSKDLK